MHRLSGETDKQKKIWKLASALLARGHGEIFEEFFSDFVIEFLGKDKGNIRLFAQEVQDYIREIIENEAETEGDLAYTNIVKWVDKRDYIPALVQYFRTHPSHGEYAGRAMAAAYLDNDYDTAFAIYAEMDEEGFDS